MRTIELAPGEVAVVLMGLKELVDSWRESSWTPMYLDVARALLRDERLAS